MTHADSGVMTHRLTHDGSRMTPKPTVYIETYGCQMNVSDSELMLGKLAAEGYTPVDQPDGADVILVNTCAIRDHAEQRVIGRVGELKRAMKQDTILGVTGCMAQRLGERLLKTSHVSLVIGPDGYRALPTLIESVPAGNGSPASTGAQRLTAPRRSSAIARARVSSHPGSTTTNSSPP